MSRISRTFTKQNGQLMLDKKALNRDIELLPDGEYKLIIEPVHDLKLEALKRYYFACIDDLGRHLGYTRQEMRALVKEHLSWNDQTGEPLSLVDIHDMQTMTDRLHELQQWSIANFNFTFKNLDK